MEARPGGQQRIMALMPEAEVLNYSTELRSMTSGRGSYTMKLNGYEELEELINGFAKGGEKLSASKFAASIKEVKGNKAEREILCGILGVCDILQHPDHSGFLDQYRSVNKRERPKQHFIDLEWPLCWHNSSFAVNQAAVEKISAN